MSVETEMLACETALLHTDFSASPQQLDQLLADDFTEVAANGRVAGLSQVRQWLLAKDAAARWQFEQFQVTVLGPELRLVRYQARQVLPVPSGSKGAWHASIWTCSGQTGNWQLRFHQATRLP